MTPVTIDEAVARGTRIVNLPVIILLCTPAVVLIPGGHVLSAQFGRTGYRIFTASLLIGCFVAAWVWWSIQVPKWRLWAYERVDDIPALKRRAIKAGLIWPDGSIFARTEIKSAAHAARERELERSQPLE